MGKVIIKDNATGILMSLDNLLELRTSGDTVRLCKSVDNMDTFKSMDSECDEVEFSPNFIDKLRTLTITEQVFDETELLMLLSFMGRHNEYEHPLFSKLKDMLYEMRDTNVN